MEIDISGATQLAAGFARAETALRTAAERMIERLALAGQRPAMEATPVDTGTARRGWMTEASGFQGRLYNDVEYVYYIDKGRSAGAAMPPAGALLAWMGRHGIPPEAEFVVRRGISERGIPPKNMSEQALSAMTSALAREQATFVAEVVKALGL